MNDLVGKASYMQVVVLNATGRLPERIIADWMEAIHICLSWPDPRIWCNQVGALAGSIQTLSVPAATAGILASDSKIYGPRTVIEGIRFIHSALEQHQNNNSIDQIISNLPASGGKPMVMGYARPLAKGDERIIAMERTTKELGIITGEHYKLAKQVDEYLLQHYQESMNINGYAAAMLADFGYEPDEAYRIFSYVVASGVIACYTDTRAKPANTFLPLRCTDIRYTGKSARPVPDQ